MYSYLYSVCKRVCFKGLDERQKILQMHSESSNDEWRKQRALLSAHYLIYYRTFTHATIHTCIIFAISLSQLVFASIQMIMLMCKYVRLQNATPMH